MTNPHAPEQLDILSVPASFFATYQQAEDFVAQRIATGEKTLCVAINPEKVRTANAHPELRALLQQADMGIIDGIGIVLAGVLLHGRRLSRITGVDLFGHLVKRAAREGWKVFLLGAAEEANAGTAQRLREEYPELQIVGRRDGYFTDDEAVVRQISDSGAQLLFVAMGSPRQEFWMRDHMHEIGATFFMGLGGTFDVYSGRVARAPALFRRAGLEFFYRLLQDPRRWRRQLNYPLFVGEILAARMRKRKRKKK